MDREARIEALERRLADVEARLELYQLASAYGPTIDGGGDTAVAALFAEEAEWRMDMPGVGPTKGREAIEGIFKSAMHRSAIANGIAHTLSFPHVLVDGDTAKIVCYSIILLKGETGWLPGRVGANLFTCERRDGRWQIVSRDNMQLGQDTGRGLFASVPFKTGAG